MALEHILILTVYYCAVLFIFVYCVCVCVRACNPRKLAKYGTPVRVVCEAVLGYICNMETHTAVGKKLKARVLSLAD
jgi:hypothetical protein